MSNRIKLFGTSLSGCVADIVHGVVDYDQVVKIVSGVCVTGGRNRGWAALRAEYESHHWFYRLETSEFEQAAEIVKRLRADRKIEQPRRTCGKAPVTEGGGLYWVTSERHITLVNVNEI